MIQRKFVCSNFDCSVYAFGESAGDVCPLCGFNAIQMTDINAATLVQIYRETQAFLGANRSPSMTLAEIRRILSDQFLASVRRMQDEGMLDSEIARNLGMTVTKLRATIAILKDELHSEPSPI